MTEDFQNLRVKPRPIAPGLKSYDLPIGNSVTCHLIVGAKAVLEGVQPNARVRIELSGLVPEIEHEILADANIQQFAFPIPGEGPLNHVTFEARNLSCILRALSGAIARSSD